MSHDITTGTPFFAYLDTVGDGSGTKNAVGDYLSTAQDFKYTARGQGVDIERMLVMVEDGQGMRAEFYAALAQDLVNGITFKTTDSDGTTMQDLTDGIPIKQNAQWGALCYDVAVKEWGAGNEFILVRWTFGHSGASLHLNAGESLVAVLNDTMTAIVTQTFMIQGVKR